MNIYEHLDYRKIISLQLKEMKLTFRKLAQSTGINASYFSRAMVKKASFSQEQLFSIGKIFELDTEAMGFFLLLGMMDSSGSSNHRKYIREQIDHIRHVKLKLKETFSSIEVIEANKIEFAKYYLDPITAKIHMYLTIPKYQHNPNLIVKILNLKKSRFDEQIQILQSLNIIRKVNDSIIVLKDSLLLEENDYLSPLNHINWRLQSIQQIIKRNIKLSDYHFTAAFSANGEIKTIIKDKFKKLLVEIKDMVVPIENPEDVYYMTFDLYDEKDC